MVKEVLVFAVVFSAEMETQQTGHNPLLKEGTPRRSKTVMLPRIIGAAGVVNNPVFEPENHRHHLQPSHEIFR